MAGPCILHARLGLFPFPNFPLTPAPSALTSLRMTNKPTLDSTQDRLEDFLSKLNGVRTLLSDLDRARYEVECGLNNLLDEFESLSDTASELEDAMDEMSSSPESEGHDIDPSAYGIKARWTEDGVCVLDGAQKFVAYLNRGVVGYKTERESYEFPDGTTVVHVIETMDEEAQLLLDNTIDYGWGTEGV